MSEFMKNLTELKHEYRNLFIDDKHSAQRNWMLIQNNLSSGDKYSLEQISKIWCNIHQIYSNVIENGSDQIKIAWKHFNHLHSVISQIKDNNCENEISVVRVKNDVDPEVKSSSDHSKSAQDPVTAEEESIHGNSLEKSRQKATSLDDILNYLRARDEKHDEQIKQMQDIMKNILDCLKQ